MSSITIGGVVYEQATKHRKPPVLIEKQAGDSPSSAQQAQPKLAVPLAPVCRRTGKKG
jgi:hypothetical protein